MASEALSAARQASRERAPSNNLSGRSVSLVDHHRDAANPDKPLYLLIPAGAIAVLGLLGAIAYLFLYIVENLPAGDFALGFLLGLAAYVFGVLLFSYAYELYDWQKAWRMALKLGLVGIAVLFVTIVIFMIIAAMLKSDSKGGFSKSRSKSSSGGGSGISLRLIGRMFDWATSHVTLNANQLPSSFVPLNLTPAGTCSFCARPLPPGGGAPPPAAADAEAFCPKCGQAFVPAGERALPHTAQGTCMKCGVYTTLSPAGLCPGCAAGSKASVAGA